MTFPRRRELRDCSVACYARYLGCVLRVPPPLNALLPPRPAELISSQIRLWGSPSEVCSATRWAVRPLDPRNPLEVSNAILDRTPLLQDL
jgi:hypothetical protein